MMQCPLDRRHWKLYNSVKTETLLSLNRFGNWNTENNHADKRNNKSLLQQVSKRKASCGFSLLRAKPQSIKTERLCNESTKNPSYGINKKQKQVKGIEYNIRKSYSKLLTTCIKRHFKWGLSVRRNRSTVILRYGSTQWSTCPLQFWNNTSMSLGAGSISLSSNFVSPITCKTTIKYENYRKAAWSMLNTFFSYLIVADTSRGWISMKLKINVTHRGNHCPKTLLVVWFFAGNKMLSAPRYVVVQWNQNIYIYIQHKYPKPKGISKCKLLRWRAKATEIN